MVLGRPARAGNILTFQDGSIRAIERSPSQFPKQIRFSRTPFFIFDRYICVFPSFRILSLKNLEFLQFCPPAPRGRRRRRRRRKNFPSRPDPIPSRRDNISRSGPAPHSDKGKHRFLLLYFSRYGSWRPLDITNTMSEDVCTQHSGCQGPP